MTATTPSPSPSASPSPSPSPKLALAPVWYHGARTSKVVALTFDDGWSPSNTLKILAVLEHEKVPATFFPVGRAIAAYPDVWRKVVAAGFPLGNHTYAHATLTRHNLSWILADLRHQRQIVADVLGTTMLSLLRPPGGAWNTTTQKAATADGDEALILWDVDTRDWSGISASTDRRRALAGGEGSIVLMHASLDNTPAALPGIIAGYRDRGYSFVTLGQMFGLPGAVPTFAP